jgi:hypothetical protein
MMPPKAAARTKQNATAVANAATALLIWKYKFTKQEVVAHVEAACSGLTQAGWKFDGVVSPPAEFRATSERLETVNLLIKLAVKDSRGKATGRRSNASRRPWVPAASMRGGGRFVDAITSTWQGTPGVVNKARLAAGHLIGCLGLCFVAVSGATGWVCNALNAVAGESDVGKTIAKLLGKLLLFPTAALYAVSVLPAALIAALADGILPAGTEMYGETSLALGADGLMGPDLQTPIARIKAAYERTKPVKITIGVSHLLVQNPDDEILLAFDYDLPERLRVGHENAMAAWERRRAEAVEQARPVYRAQTFLTDFVTRRREPPPASRRRSASALAPQPASGSRRSNAAAQTAPQNQTTALPNAVPSAHASVSLRQTQAANAANAANAGARQLTASTNWTRGGRAFLPPLPTRVSPASDPRPRIASVSGHGASLPLPRTRSRITSVSGRGGQVSLPPLPTTVSQASSSTRSRIASVSGRGGHLPTPVSPASNARHTLRTQRILPRVTRIASVSGRS